MSVMSIERKITCYHGTSKNNAEKILKEQIFLESDRETDWLGRGIYFFEEKEDALWWNSHSRFIGQKMEILEVELEFPEDSWLDLDDRGTKRSVTSFVQERLRHKPLQLQNLIEMDRYKRQCFFCNYLQNYIPEIRIRSYNFPAKFQSNNPFDFGFSTRKQFCVVEQSIIKVVNGQKWR